MRFILSAAAGLLVACIGFEVALQCMPVASGVRIQDSSAADPIPRYRPLQPYTYSFGWALSNTHHAATNRQGYSNSRDFTDGANALVVGDSFIESFMVDYGESVQGVLDAAVGKVYAAGRSGNGLADALVVARHYLPSTHARTVIFFVEPYDIRDIDKPGARGHNQFDFGPQGVSISHVPYVESPSKERVLKSALLRYLYYNLKFPEWLKSQGMGKPAEPDATALAQQRARRAQALDYLMGELASLQREHGTRFVFLVDGDRNGLYSKGKSVPNWRGDERDMLIQSAKGKGFDVVDMQPVFAAHWNRYHERLDWLPMDGHWNRVAHKLAAQQLLPLVQAPR